MKAEKREKRCFLKGARVYLSGPMDFVASRADEKRSGWRVRVKAFLQSLGAVVFDPWEKPGVRGLHQYGREDATTTSVRESWTFEPTAEGAQARAEIAWGFWKTMHVDLRMVDVSDFVVAYCPTNTYSVGTPHEIVIARQQHKPVLLVSPPIELPALDRLKSHLAESADRAALDLLEELVKESPIKPNPTGAPSLWYMPLVGGDNFFDGFGFDGYRARFGWPVGPLDEREREHPPQRSLLPFLASINDRLPRKWSVGKGRFVPNDDWLLLDL